jgi:SAM-dependent methyltransferase
MSSILKDNYINLTYKSSNNDYTKKFCKQIIKKYKISKGSKILDIGCGNGIITRTFQELGMDCKGIDISDSSSSLLGENFKKFNLAKKDYPYSNGEFDYIFSKSVIEHLQNPEILIDEAYRVLKPGGTFICMTPSWKHSYKEAFYIDHTHVTPFTRFSLETICEMSNFEADCEYFYQLPLLWKYPFLNFFRYFIEKIPLPYRPFDRINWPDNTNKIIRFSKEAMLICSCKK